jgi:hypothetical protein
MVHLVRQPRVCGPGQLGAKALAARGWPGSAAACEISCARAISKTSSHRLAPLGLSLPLRSLKLPGVAPARLPTVRRS